MTTCFHIWKLDQTFSHFFSKLRTCFIFCFFLFVVIIHLLQKGEGVGIYCNLIPDWIKSTQARLNRIDPSMNNISCPTQRGIQEPNSKYYLENYFNISYNNHPHFIYTIWLQPQPEYLALKSFLDAIPQSIKLSQPKSRAEHTDVTNKQRTEILKMAKYPI